MKATLALAVLMTVSCVDSRYATPVPVEPVATVVAGAWFELPADPCPDATFVSFTLEPHVNDRIYGYVRAPKIGTQWRIWIPSLPSATPASVFVRCYGSAGQTTYQTMFQTLVVDPAQ
jgi:hypothetical protein